MKLIGKFIIVNLETMDYFKNGETKEIEYFETEDDAVRHAWIYELENVHILELKNYYNES